MIRSLRLEFLLTVYNFTVIAAAYSRRASSSRHIRTLFHVLISDRCVPRALLAHRRRFHVSSRRACSTPTSKQWHIRTLVPRLDDPIVASEVFYTVHNPTVIAAAYSRRAASESASFAGYRLRRASTACSGRCCAGSVSLRRWLGAMLTRTSKQWHIPDLVPRLDDPIVASGVFLHCL